MIVMVMELMMTVMVGVVMIVVLMDHSVLSPHSAQHCP